MVYWICFGDSAHAVLKSVCKECDPDLQYQNILVLPDDLSQGDLSAPAGIRMREQTACLCGYEDKDGMAQSKESICANFEKSLPALATCEAVTIWYGKNAEEQCGFLYTVYRLWQRRIPIWIVSVDEMPVAELQEPIWLNHKRGQEACVVGVIGVLKNNGKPLRRPQWYLRWRVRQHLHRLGRQNREERRTIHYMGVGSLQPEDVSYFYNHRRLLTEEECCSLANQWEALYQQNAPLRIFKDGAVCSASGDYYDGLILSEVPVRETGAVTVIGNVIVKHHLAISEVLIYKRLLCLIAQGKVRVVSDAENYRELIIRRGG